MSLHCPSFVIYKMTSIAMHMQHKCTFCDLDLMPRRRVSPEVDVLAETREHLGSDSADTGRTWIGLCLSQRSQQKSTGSKFESCGSSCFSFLPMLLPTWSSAAGVVASHAHVVAGRSEAAHVSVALRSAQRPASRTPAEFLQPPAPHFLHITAIRPSIPYY